MLAFCVCDGWGLLPGAVGRLFIVVASLVVEDKLEEPGLQ